MHRGQIMKTGIDRITFSPPSPPFFPSRLWGGAGWPCPSPKPCLPWPLLISQVLQSFGGWGGGLFIGEVMQGFGVTEGGHVNSRQSLALPACDAQQGSRFPPPDSLFVALCNHSICCLAACPLRPLLPFRGGMGGMGGYTESSGQPPSKKPPPMPPTKAVPPPPVTLSQPYMHPRRDWTRFGLHPTRNSLLSPGPYPKQSLAPIPNLSPSASIPHTCRLISQCRARRCQSNPCGWTQMICVELRLTGLAVTFFVVIIVIISQSTRWCAPSTATQRRARENCLCKRVTKFV